MMKKSLLVAFFVVEGQGVSLAHAIEHGVDRDRNPPIVQRGFLGRPTLEPAPHVGRCPCTARTSQPLFIRGGIRTIHVHSTSARLVSLVIPTVTQHAAFDSRLYTTI